jgi:transcriptional regulator with XRE-family HTH domain
MNLNTTESLESIFEQQEQSIGFWEEMAIIEFTEAVLEQLELHNMSKMDLAERMNVSPAYITKLIGGSNNFTLRTMVKIARSLGCELKLSLRQPGVRHLRYRMATPDSSTPPSDSAKLSENEELHLAA